MRRSKLSRRWQERFRLCEIESKRKKSRVNGCVRDIRTKKRLDSLFCNLRDYAQLERRCVTAL